MFDAILELPAPLSALVFVLGTIALALASYTGMRALTAGRGDEDRRDLANSVIFRVSALHGLILALVFAQEIGNLGHADDAAAREAMLVADSYYDLERFDAEATLPIRQALADYAHQVVAVEWPMLARERRLDDTAWSHWTAAYEQVLDLSATTPRQEVLLDLVHRNIREVSSLRRARENAALEGAEPLFLVAALVGVVFTAASYFTYAPGRLNLFLLSVFAAYTGLVIYFIVAFANPFHAPGMVKPTGFQQILAGGIGAPPGG